MYTLEYSTIKKGFHLEVNVNTRIQKYVTFPPHLDVNHTTHMHTHHSRELSSVSVSRGEAGLSETVDYQEVSMV